MAISIGILQVDGLDCPTEESRIRHELENRPGIISMRFDLENGRLTLEFDDQLTSLEALAAAVTARCGYGCRLFNLPDTTAISGDPSGKKSSDLKVLLFNRLDRRTLLVICSGVLILCGLPFSYSGRNTVSDPLFILSMISSSLWIIPRVKNSLHYRRLDIYVLVALAVAGAMILRLFDEAATVGVLFGVSEILEAYATRRARISIDALMEIQPDLAEKLMEDGSVEIVRPESLRIGDRVRVRPAQKLPVDGKVKQGRSHIDQKVITGESIPVSVAPDDDVFAGTINGEGVLTVECRRILEDSVVNRIARKVESARSIRAPIQRLVDRFANRYTPMIVSFSVLIMLIPPLFNLASEQPAHWDQWLLRGLVLLVVACPCALVISTPVAIVSAVANAARHGVLVRDGSIIEQFGRLRLIAFDKTGTLTIGQPSVVEVQTVTTGESHESLLRKAAAIGQSGSHVVSQAIVRHAVSQAIQLPVAEDVQEVPGLGSTGLVQTERIHMGSHRFLDQEGLCHPDFHSQIGLAESTAGTSVAVAGQQGPIGWIRLADEPRSEAKRALNGLHELGIHTIMLTGDNLVTAKAIADELGIDEYRAQLLPDQKAEIIRELVLKYQDVGMVGDGVNDAPALTEARIGISMGSVASALTSQTADVVLINNNLMSLHRLMLLSRKSVRIIKTNFIMALGSKLLVLILAALGVASFLLAMLADVGISLIVVANSLRLLKYQSDKV